MPIYTVCGKNMNIDQAPELEASCALPTEREREYEYFRTSIAGLRPLEKATAWLAYKAGHRETYGDLEAVVFLARRGQDTTSEVKKVIAEWRVAEKQHIADHNARSSPITDDIAATYMSYFWRGGREAEHTLEATMLRAVESCRIGGFDHWWERIVQDTKEYVLDGAFGGIPGVLWLFEMCRSDYALRAMPTVLEHVLDSIVMPRFLDVLLWQDAINDAGISDNIRRVSTIVFAEQRLEHKTGLIREAVCTLERHYKNGSWPTWMREATPSIETTAMAMHALAMTRPRGWEDTMAEATSWLLSVQNPDGYWADPKTHDQVYLTVLVLDALALGSQSSATLTFLNPPPSVLAPSPADVHSRGGRTKLCVTRWQEIEICFISDHRVQIRSGEQTETCNYAELGFEDGRNRKPTRAWMLLCDVSENNGTISDAGKTKGDWSKMEKRVQEIRKVLRQYFGIAEDPIPYVDGSGYYPRFRLLRAPSFDT
jgi:hypothetical protein